MLRKTPLKRSGSLNRGTKSLSGTSGLIRDSNPVWHIKTKLKKLSEKGKEKKAERNILMAQMIEMFKELWQEVPHVCSVTGVYLGEEPLTTFFHHILPKSLYEEYTLCKWNICILHPDIHNQVENNLESVPLVYELTQELKKKHLNGELCVRK